MRLIPLPLIFLLVAACGGGGESRSSEKAEAVSGLVGEYSNADYDNGARQWRRCASCHLISSNGNHLVGPNLHGLFDRRVGEATGFRYSEALQDADFQWTPEQLELWLLKPDDFLEGNNMRFQGVPDDADRRDLIAYLMLEASGD